MISKKYKTYKFIELIIVWLCFFFIGFLIFGCATDTKPRLHKYIEEGDTERAKELIHRRAYINAIDRETKMTPLELAVIYDQPGIARLLIEKGADVNAQNPFGWSALHFTAYYGEDDIVELLLNKGANVFEAGVRNRKALFLHKDRYPAKVYDETFYANALLYRIAAEHSNNRSMTEESMERYKIAAKNFKEASILFKDRADSFESMIEGNIVEVILRSSLMFATFGIANELDYNIYFYDDPALRQKTFSLFDLIKFKNIYTDKSNSSNEAYLECDKRIKCYQNSNQENEAKCFK